MIDLLNHWSRLVSQLTTVPRALFGLAIARIGIGVSQLSLYLSDYGARYDLFGEGMLYPGALPSEVGSFSLYQFFPSGRVWFEILFHTGILCCLLLICGLGGRFTIVAVWVTCWSLWTSNPMVIDGGDNVAMIVLLFLMVSRCMDRLSLRTILRWPQRFVRLNESWPVVLLNNSAVGGIIVQLGIVYFLSGMFKAQGTMWVDGTALYYILRTPEYFFPPLTPLILGSDHLLVAGTYAGMISLIAFPFLILSRKTRRYAVLAMVLFHLGIGILMGLTSFAVIMIACDCVLVSSDLERAYKRVMVRLSTLRRRPARRAAVDTCSPANEVVGESA